MAKNKALGADPLGWIQNTRKNKDESKQGIHSIQKTQADPTEKTKGPVKTSREGLPQGWTRASFIIREDHINNLKAWAYWERMKIKDVLDQALDSFLSGKKVKPIPRKEK